MIPDAAKLSLIWGAFESLTAFREGFLKMPVTMRHREPVGLVLEIVFQLEVTNRELERAL